MVSLSNLACWRWILCSWIENAIFPFMTLLCIHHLGFLCCFPIYYAVSLHYLSLCLCHTVLIIWSADYLGTVQKHALWYEVRLPFLVCVSHTSLVSLVFRLIFHTQTHFRKGNGVQSYDLSHSLNLCMFFLKDPAT